MGEAGINPRTGGPSITIVTVTHSASIFTHSHNFILEFSTLPTALLHLLFPSCLPDPSCISYPRKKNKKRCISIPLLWRCRISHSWEYILNLASQSISDKHIMFYFKHKMQFWSFHNDTVNRDTAKKRRKKSGSILFFTATVSQRTTTRWWNLTCICFCFGVFFYISTSMFNYQVCSFRGCLRRGRPPRSKPAGTLEPDQTVSGLEAAEQRPQAASIRVILGYRQPWNTFVGIVQALVALAQLNTTARWTSLKDLWDSLPPDGGLRSATLDLYPRLGAPLVADGGGWGGGVVFVQAALIHERCDGWLRKDDGCRFRMFSERIGDRRWRPIYVKPGCWRVVGLISWSIWNFLLEFGIDVDGALVFPAFLTNQVVPKRNCATVRATVTFDAKKKKNSF